MSSDRMVRRTRAPFMAALSRAVLLALVIGAATVNAQAQTKPTAQTPTAQTPTAQTWQVVSDESRLGFVATQLGAPFEGTFGAFSAEIAFDKDDLAASGANVTIEIGTLDTGEDQRDDQARGPDFFDAAAHPQAIFRTDTIRAEGSDYVADGTLTMKGVSKPVTLPFTLTFEGEDTVRMIGSLTVDRTEWGVGTGEWLSGDTVGKDVEIRIRLLARK